MYKQVIKKHIQVLVAVRANGDFIEKVELFPHLEGLAFEIKGLCSASLESQIQNFMDRYLLKKDAPLPLLDYEQIKTPFTHKVLLSLAQIRFGQTLTYRELAAANDSPQGARAVGGACGRNPFPFFIPCHRVLSHKGMGGFSCGIAIKKRLLGFEVR